MKSLDKGAPHCSYCEQYVCIVQDDEPPTLNSAHIISDGSLMVRWRGSVPDPCRLAAGVPLLPLQCQHPAVLIFWSGCQCTTQRLTARKIYTAVVEVVPLGSVWYFIAGCFESSACILANVDYVSVVLLQTVNCHSFVLQGSGTAEKLSCWASSPTVHNAAASRLT